MLPHWERPHCSDFSGPRRPSLEIQNQRERDTAAFFTHARPGERKKRKPSPFTISRDRQHRRLAGDDLGQGVALVAGGQFSHQLGQRGGRGGGVGAFVDLEKKRGVFFRECDRRRLALALAPPAPARVAASPAR